MSKLSYEQYVEAESKILYENWSQPNAGDEHLDDDSEIETYPTRLSEENADYETYPIIKLPKLDSDLHDLTENAIDNTEEITLVRTIHRGQLNFVAYGLYENKTQIAVKCAPFKISHDILMHEIHILAKLQHLSPESSRYCVQLIGLTIEAGIFVFCPKGNLRSLLETQKINIPMSRRIQFLSQTTNGLLFLQKLGVLHRDLKADNLLLDDNENIKIADFGCATFNDDKVKSYHHGAYRNQSPQMLWVSAKYKCPTVLKENIGFEEPEEFTLSDEMYTFTLVAFHILSSEQPFIEFGRLNTETSFKNFFLKVAVEHFRPSIPDYLPPPLAKLIKRGWGHNPYHRPEFEEFNSVLSKSRTL